MAFSVYIKKKFAGRFHWKYSLINCNMKALRHCTVSQTVDEISWIVFSHSSVLFYEGKALGYSAALYKLKIHLFSVCLFSSLSYKTFCLLLLDLWLLCSAGVPSRLGLRPNCQSSAFCAHEVPWDLTQSLKHRILQGGEKLRAQEENLGYTDIIDLADTGDTKA